MKVKKFLIFFFLILPINLYGQDDLDDFINEINLTAQKDIGEFKTQISFSFNKNISEVESIMAISEKPADTYMIFRVSEITKKPLEEVINVYKQYKTEGWGKIAKRLGIKPGSQEFKELKKVKLSNKEKERKKEKIKKGKAHNWD